MPGMGGMDMNGMDMGGMRSSVLGSAGDVSYPYFLVNGRTPADPTTFRAKAGERVRIRLVNAGTDTAFRVALGGHQMTVTHSDGYPVQRRATDALMIGMGERYDVTVTLEDGIFPLVASAEGKPAQGFALVRTGAGRAPADRPSRGAERTGAVSAPTWSPRIRCGWRAAPSTPSTPYACQGPWSPTAGPSTAGPTPTPRPSTCTRANGCGSSSRTNR